VVTCITYLTVGVGVAEEAFVPLLLAVKARLGDGGQDGVVHPRLARGASLALRERLRGRAERGYAGSKKWNEVRSGNAL
jgi:hypothetical protein